MAQFRLKSRNWQRHSREISRLVREELFGVSGAAYDDARFT